ncbi:MAG: hypothetical protein IKA85_04645 [Clostridia bacterium]|nr:hypothetical protein [Clostridia bacterium]
MQDKKYIIRQGVKEDFYMMNQTGVKQVIINEPNHNACWDANLSKDGILYFSVCSEHTHHEFAKLYKYEFDKNQATECFYTRDFLLKSDRYLRDSKFHTSINFKPDGKLIMVTHSTDKSPCHPAWLPCSFVSNPWEGFPGGELMEYDPKTGKVELFGIPAPRESIYGAVYSPKDDAYYMLGWIRGHLYRFDCKTRKSKDLGQASEYRSYRIVLGPDQNLYFSTKSGHMMRYNVDLQKIEDLGVRIPCDKTHKGKVQPFTYMGPCVTGPDGRLYTTGNYTSLLSAYDIKTGKMEVVGDLVPADDFTDLDDQHTFVAGMDFDKDGVLWYSTMSFRAMEDEHFKVPAGFFRWDFLRGKKPEYLGIFGTATRVQTYTDSLMIDKERDILYSASTNHSYGSPDIIAVDLKKYRENMYEKGEICRDMLVYAPGHEEFHPFAEHWQDIKIKIAKYAANVKAKHISPVRLWDKFSQTNILNAKVKGIAFVDDNTVEGICGDTENYLFTIKDGKFDSVKLATDADVNRIIKTKPENVENLPCYPGRPWRANVTCECEWLDGSKIVGTEDGFIAKIRKDGTIYSIGPAICQGPVRDICADVKTGVCYGVGGDVEDMGNVFKYTEEKGLEYLGFMCCDVADNDVGVCANFVLSSIAISPNGKKLAVGAMDRLACAYVLDMD